MMVTTKCVICGECFNSECTINQNVTYKVERTILSVTPMLVLAESGDQVDLGIAGPTCLNV